MAPKDEVDRARDRVEHLRSLIRDINSHLVGEYDAPSKRQGQQKLRVVSDKSRRVERRKRPR